MSTGHAQTSSGVVFGTVTGELAEEGLPDAVVMLVADSMVVARTACVENGNYRLTYSRDRIKAADQVLVLVSYVGYDNFVADSLKFDDTNELALDVRLELQVGGLSGVEFEVAAPAVRSDVSIVRMPRRVSLSGTVYRYENTERAVWVSFDDQ